MATTTNQFGVVRWTSKKFDKDIGNLPETYHFYDDNDKRIIRISDVRGESYWVVGFKEEMILPVNMNGHGKIDSALLVVRDRDNALMTLHKSLVANKYKH